VEVGRKKSAGTVARPGDGRRCFRDPASRPIANARTRLVAADTKGSVKTAARSSGDIREFVVNNVFL